MQPITSSEFRTKNQILHQTKILQGASWTFAAGCGGGYKVPLGDVLDLNNNGQVDYTTEKVGWFGRRYNATEPDLVQNVGQLKEFAHRNSAEVVTQDDVRLQIENDSVESGRVTKTNLRSIDDLVGQIEPFERSAKWAIDLTTNEFLIYKPNA